MQFIQKKRTIIIACFSGLICLSQNLFGLDVGATAEKPPAIAESVINNIHKQYQEAADRFHFPIDRQVLEYISQLQTNWSSTLRKSPNEFGEGIRAAHETMQFYFLGRTNYSQNTIETLLIPRRPFNINCLDSNGINTLARPDMEVRIAWFNLLAELDPKNVIENDSMLIVPGITAQYLRDFDQAYLFKEITSRDLDVVMGCIGKLPEFSEAYLISLVDMHKMRFGEKTIVERMKLKSNDEKYKLYQNIYFPFMPSEYAGIHLFLGHLFINRPDLFESRMLALQAWIKDSLDNSAMALEGIRNLKVGQQELADHYLKYLDKSVEEIKNAEVSHPTNTLAFIDEKISSENISTVRDLNKYIRYREQQFDVDYVAQSSGMLASIQTGDVKAALSGIQPDNAVANLTLPIAMYADYAKRSSNDQFRAGLELIRARLEGLRELADKMKWQTK
jgi:hypothetical protein